MSTFKATATAEDLVKSGKPISTGIGFFDHMIDQLNSHAQIGVSVYVETTKMDSSDQGKNRFASFDQNEVVTAVGDALGKELGIILSNASSRKDLGSSRFCCPLDEALVECNISYPVDKPGLDSFALAPYGIYPKGGRTRIGEWKTETVELFFDRIAKGIGASISLRKIRGNNGHHIVESSFKAFSRALRNLIDERKGDTEEIMWGPDSKSASEGQELKRVASIARGTKETSISIEMILDGKGLSNINTGIKTMNHLLKELIMASGISLSATCKGDTWVDDHHTVSDSAQENMTFPQETILLIFSSIHDSLKMFL